MNVPAPLMNVPLLARAQRAAIAGRNGSMQ